MKLPPIAGEASCLSVKFDWADSGGQAHSVELVSEGAGYFPILEFDELRLDPEEVVALGAWVTETCKELDDALKDA